MNPAVSHLSLYDIVNTPGVAADVSHINTKAQVTVWHQSSNTRIAHYFPSYNYMPLLTILFFMPVSELLR